MIVVGSGIESTLRPILVTEFRSFVANFGQKPPIVPEAAGRLSRAWVPVFRPLTFRSLMMYSEK